MLPPIAFEVDLKGRRLCAAGLRGKSGVLSAILSAVDRSDRIEIEFAVGGMERGAREHLTWLRRSLAIGDELTLRIVETLNTTRVRDRVNLDQELSEKHEKEYLRKTARKYGYKLVRASEGSASRKRRTTTLPGC
jgi:hypothetical protein